VRTSEGGLDVAGSEARVREAVRKLRDAGIRVSLFIDPDARQIDASVATGAEVVELHTGAYADASSEPQRRHELERQRSGMERAHAAGLIVNAGHGLTLDNVGPIAALEHIHELNIGHSIVARALFVGMEQATREMKERMLAARRGSGR
jgi:pyridoxine 5-phosphate synthase